MGIQSISIFRMSMENSGVFVASVFDDAPVEEHEEQDEMLDLDPDAEENNNNNNNRENVVDAVAEGNELPAPAVVAQALIQGDQSAAVTTRFPRQNRRLHHSKSQCRGDRGQFIKNVSQNKSQNNRKR